MTPSFFYAALMLGRFLAPAVAAESVRDVRLAQAGLLLACGGTAGLLFSQRLGGCTRQRMRRRARTFGRLSHYDFALVHGVRDVSSAIGSVMFVLSNIGGGLLPWIVGVSSNRFGTLKAGLFVPLVGCASMFALYLRNWTRNGSEARLAKLPSTTNQSRSQPGNPNQSIEAETMGVAGEWRSIRPDPA